MSSLHVLVKQKPFPNYWLHFLGGKKNKKVRELSYEEH